MSCAGLTLGEIIFGYTPRVVLPPQQPVLNATMEQVQRRGEDVSNDGLDAIFRHIKKVMRFFVRQHLPAKSRSVCFYSNSLISLTYFHLPPQRAAPCHGEELHPACDNILSGYLCAVTQYLVSMMYLVSKMEFMVLNSPEGFWRSLPQRSLSFLDPNLKT